MSSLQRFFALVILFALMSLLLCLLASLTVKDQRVSTVVAPNATSTPTGSLQLP